MINDNMDHGVTVATLRRLLTDPALRDDDVLRPNGVQNLSVIRNGQPIGYIDLGANEEVVIF